MTCFPVVFEIIKCNYAKPVAPNIDSISRAVSKAYDIALDDIRSRSRLRKYVEARHMSIFLAVQHTSMTLSEIGKFFGLDHTSVIHARDGFRGFIHSRHPNPIKEKYFEISRSFS